MVTEHLMKARARWILNIGWIVVVPLLAGGCLESSQTSDSAAALAEPLGEIPGDISESEVANEIAAEAADSNKSISDAAFQPVATERVVPASLDVSPALAELLHLADSSADETVMLAFVTNSSGPFELGADEIIYLRDIGVPSAVITAILQRDDALQASASQMLISPGTSRDPGANIQNPMAPAALPPSVPSDATVMIAPAPFPVSYAPVEDVVPEPDVVDADYAGFDEALAPYGNWMDVAGYGRCWQPRVVVVNAGWQPYFDGGRWVYTDCGWCWKSDYSWGWAAFHYGRWFQHNSLGWCWKPDHLWGPAWVCWRYEERHCGWAPLPPGADFRPGIGLTFHARPVSAQCDFGLRPRAFRFIPFQHFSDHHLPRFAVAHDQADRIFHATRVSMGITARGSTAMNLGISPAMVSAATRTPVHPIAIRETTTPTRVHAERLGGRATTLPVYRPNQIATFPVRALPRIEDRTEGRTLPANEVPATASSGTQPHRIETGAHNPRFEAVQHGGDSVRSVAGPHQPLILHGGGRSYAEEIEGRHAESLPRNSLVVIGHNRETAARFAREQSGAAHPDWRRPATLAAATDIETMPAARDTESPGRYQPDFPLAASARGVLSESSQHNLGHARRTHSSMNTSASVPSAQQTETERPEANPQSAYQAWVTAVNRSAWQAPTHQEPSRPVVQHEPVHRQAPLPEQPASSQYPTPERQTAPEVPRQHVEPAPTRQPERHPSESRPANSGGGSSSSSRQEQSSSAARHSR